MPIDLIYRTLRYFQRLALLACLILFVCTSCKQWEDPTNKASQPDFETLDSLGNTTKNLLLIQHLKPAIQLDSLLVWTVLLKDYNETAALTYTRQAAQMATENNLDKDQGVARYYLALLEGRQQIFTEGLADPLVNARISQKLFAQTDNYYWKANICHLLGDIFYRQGVLDSAAYCFEQALENLEKVSIENADFYSLKGSIFHGQGRLAFEENDLQRVDSLYQKTFELYEKGEDRKALSTLRYDLSMIQAKSGNLDSAILLLRENVEEVLEIGDVYVLAQNYQELGNLYMKIYRSNKEIADFDTSYFYFKKSLAIQKDNHFYTYRRIARLMQSRASRDLARPDYVDSALVYYQLAFEDARREGALGFFKGLSNNISRLCEWLQTEQNRDCEEILGTSASNYLFINYSGVVDTITKDLAEANTNIRLFEQQQQAERNKERVQNTWYKSGIGLLMASSLFLFLFQRQKQKRLQARMEALRAQINPHFFSNSLNAIESLVNLDQGKAASKYLIHFSRLTRRILNSSMEATTTLAGELETTKHFLALEQLRFKDKLHFDIDWADDVIPQIIEVPSLIFQPYLENAIWHGIKPKKEPSFLQIKITKEGKQLICVIEDDGVGRVEAQRLKEKTLLQRKSHGMKITNERIRRFGAGKVEVVDLYNEEGVPCGTQIILRLPYRVKKKA